MWLFELDIFCVLVFFHFFLSIDRFLLKKFAYLDIFLMVGCSFCDLVPANYNQMLFQVTSSSVRLVSSTTRELLNEWNAPSNYSINVATANASQVCSFIFVDLISYFSLCLNKIWWKIEYCSSHIAVPLYASTSDSY